MTIFLDPKIRIGAEHNMTLECVTVLLECDTGMCQFQKWQVSGINFVHLNDIFVQVTGCFYRWQVISTGDRLFLQVTGVFLQVTGVFVEETDRFVCTGVFVQVTADYLSGFC